MENNKTLIMENTVEHDKPQPTEHPSDYFEEETENSSYLLNPLTMEHIIQNVLQYLSLKDLKTCRLTHSTWKNAASSILRKKCKVIIFSQDHSTYKTKHYKLRDMRKLLKVIKTSRKFPFCKFDLETDLTDDSYQDMTPEHLQVITDFYQTVCPFVTELTIRLEFMNLLYIGEPSGQLLFSNLEVLNIDFRGDEKTVGGIEVIKRIIDNAPLLDKIKFENLYSALRGKTEENFINLLENSNCKRISSLDIRGYFSSEHMTRFIKIDPQLKSLFISIPDWNIDSEVLADFLKSQQKSLTNLVIELTSYFLGSKIVIQFPRMDKVERFEYRTPYHIFEPENLSLKNISYTDQFPMLKYLSIESNIWDQFLGFNVQPVDSVEELTLHGQISNTDCMLHVARLFPKLKMLDILADIDVMNIVYSEMPNIEELVLDTHGVNSVSDIITGLNSGDMDADVKIFEQEFNVKLFDTKSLSSLKKLKTLRLKGVNKDVELGEIACRFLLNQMDSLQCLDFHG